MGKSHNCIGAGCTFCLQEREMFRMNTERYEATLKTYGFERANGYTTATRVVWSHSNGWAVELRADRQFRLMDPDGETSRSDEYLNDLISALDHRIELGRFKK